MRSNAITICVDHCWPLATGGIIAGSNHGLVGVYGVSTIAVEDLQVCEAAEVLCYNRVSCLLMERDGNPILVVLDNEYNWELLTVGTVDSFVVVPLGCSAVACGAEHHLVALELLDRAGCTHSLLRVIPCA